MLSKPKYGWSTITIGDWSDRCSYLTDVPFQLLEAMCDSCKNHKPAAETFDAEGWDYTIIFDWLEIHIIISKDSFELKTIEINRDELAKELVEDIRNNIDEWASWIDYGDIDEKRKQLRKELLLATCDDLMVFIPSDDWKVVYCRENSNNEVI